jgi:hypothetical protein
VYELVDVVKAHGSVTVVKTKSVRKRAA